MESFFAVRDSVANYLTLSAKRRQSAKLNSPASKLAAMQRPMTPVSEAKKAKATISGRVTKKYLSPADSQPSVSKVNKAQEGEDQSEHDEEEEEGDDYLTDDEDENEETEEVGEENESEVMGPADSVSQIGAREDYDDSEFHDQVESEEDLDSNLDEELSADAKVHLFLDHQAELARRQEALNTVKEGDWHPDEVALFKKLSLRGFEPLLPSHWKMDFRTVPAGLFSPKDEETFINAQYGSNFRATKALLSLFTLGSYVRSRSECSIPEEPRIKKELDSYLKWAAKDGDYAHLSYLPVLVIVAAQPNQDLTAISADTTSQLTLLAKQHRRALSHPAPGLINEDGDVEIFKRTPPALYGIIIIRSVVIFVTLDCGNPNAKLRTLAHFDFAKKDMDVWNGFAVAILVCTVRNYLMETSDEMDELEVKDKKDPDISGEALET